MYSWKARFRIARQCLQEEMDEDEFVAGLMLGLQGEDEEEECQGGGGSRPRKCPNVERACVKINWRMMKDYFVDNPVYGPDLFCCRYRMRHSLLVSILDSVCAFDSYFMQKYDACGL